MADNITIDPTIRDLIPPLSPTEFENLENAIVADGVVREPLVTWNGTLYDGHHRLLIAEAHGIPYTVEEKDFANEFEALCWVFQNQRSRRNATKTQLAVSVVECDELVANVREQARQNQVAAGGKDDTAFTTKRKSAQAVHTNEFLAGLAGCSPDLMTKVLAVQKAGRSDLMELMRSGELSATKAYNTLRREQKADEIRHAQSIIADEVSDDGTAVLYVADSVGRTVECDLLLADPPYSTDVPNINEFVTRWLYPALMGVKPTGCAYVFCGSYPDELRAYLNAEIPAHMELVQVLDWTYKNTLGSTPKGQYTNDKQHILFYRGRDAPSLNVPLTSEAWSVIEINAPDGRLGDRLHPWQKPLELAEMYIRHTTEKGMVVFDPFSGTGTTLVAAARLGRHGVGFEISPATAELAYSRGVDRGVMEEEDTDVTEYTTDVTTTRKPHVAHDTGQVEQYTPREYIEAARATMGCISLAPLSSPKANETIKAETYYGKEDGLALPWFGTIWLDPPFERELKDRFADKLVAERDHYDQAIVFVLSNTETKWFQKMASVASAMCLITGRVRPLDSDGRKGKPPLKGHAALYVGSNVDDFMREFANFGICVMIDHGTEEPEDVTDSADVMGPKVRELPTKQGARNDITSVTTGTEVTKREAEKQVGISHKTAIDLQAMAEHTTVDTEDVTTVDTEDVTEYVTPQQAQDAIAQMARTTRRYVAWWREHSWALGWLGDVDGDAVRDLWESMHVLEDTHKEAWPLLTEALIAIRAAERDGGSAA